MTAPMIANALPRTAAGNSSWMNAVTGGKKMPPPRPCTTRATIELRVVLREPAREARQR